jgi:sigma-B regulation protein RsbU (phosphoserine phosphatase)
MTENILTVAPPVTQDDTALRRSRLLLRASEALSVTATTADVLLIVPDLLREALGAKHADVVTAGGAPRGPVSDTLTSTAMRDRRSRYYESSMDVTLEHPQLAEELERAGWQAAVCAPLALYVAQALERASRHDSRTAITDTLQKAIMSRLPHVDDFELAAYYRAADTDRKVGGDWYDVIPGPHGRLALVIGDVVGHDTTATARMGELRNMVRAYLVDRREPPSALLRRLDAANFALGEPAMATAVVAFLDRAPHGGFRLRWSNAGHPPPVLISNDGEVRPLTGNDLLLGARRGSPRHTYTATLEPGSIVLLHTDGLVESRGTVIDEGFQRLYGKLRIRNAGAPRDLLARVAREMTTDRADDVAMLAVRIPR